MEHIVITNINNHQLNYGIGNKLYFYSDSSQSNDNINFLQPVVWQDGQVKTHTGIKVKALSQHGRIYYRQSHIFQHTWCKVVIFHVGFSSNNIITHYLYKYNKGGDLVIGYDMIIFQELMVKLGMIPVVWQDGQVKTHAGINVKALSQHG